MKMVLRALAIAGALILAPIAQAQQFPSGYVQGNSSASAAPARAISPSAWLNRWCGSSQYSFVMATAASTWGCLSGANLNALAGLTSAADKIAYFTGAGTAAVADYTALARTLDANATAAGMRSTLGVVIGTNVQAWDADLDCIAANSTAGLLAYTGAGTCSYRTLTAPAAGFTITNPAGTAGNPTFVLANDLAALEGLSSTGIARRTGTDAWSVGTAVSNAELATMAAYTFKGNNTGSTAVPTDVDIAGLTTKASPAASDYVILSDQAASGAWKKATVSSVGSAGSVSSIAGNTGAFTLSSGITNSTNDIRIDPAFGGWKLLATLTASASATLSDTSSLTATYSEYELVFANLIPATNNTTLNLLVHEAGTFPATVYVANLTWLGAALSNVTTTAAIQLSATSAVQNSGPGYSGKIRVSNPSGTTDRKTFWGQASHFDGARVVTAFPSGYWNGGNAAVDGFQVSFSSGNITSGTIKIYGRN